MLAAFYVVYRPAISMLCRNARRHAYVLSVIFEDRYFDRQFGASILV